MAANFFGRISLYHLADARLRSHMLVCLLSFLFHHSVAVMFGSMSESLFVSSSFLYQQALQRTLFDPHLKLF